VAADKLHGGVILRCLSGEHVAATEFVIGALFVALGLAPGMSVGL
jgi:hypothetical protein